MRSSAETAEHIQAGASGPWQEYNGSGWVRTQMIRALPQCGTAADDCVYISGSLHQQHTHGVYARTSMHCDGKPVYLQQTGQTHWGNGGSPPEARHRGSVRPRGGRRSRINGDDGYNDYRRLYLFSPSGRESWMVGRDACKPSGWLEVHSAVDRVEVRGSTAGSKPPKGCMQAACKPHASRMRAACKPRCPTAPAMAQPLRPMA